MSPFLGVAGLGGAGGNSRKAPPPEDTWISLSGISHWSNSENLVVDSDKNIFTWGKHTNLHSQGGSYSFWVVKFDSDGIPAWHRGIGGAGNEYMVSQAENIATDSSGSVYVIGYSDSTTGTGTGERRGILIKWNSSGTLQYKKRFTMSGTTQTYATATECDSNDNVWCSGYHYSGSGSIGFLTKLASNGNVSWTKDFNDMAQIRGIVFDSSDNAYCTGRVGSLNLDDGFIMKVSSSGNIDWSTKFGVTTGTISDFARTIGMDSSGNLYVAGYISNSYGGYTPHGFLAKFNSSGTYQWTRHIGQTESNSGYETMLENLVVHNDTIYVAGLTQGIYNTRSTGILVAFDTSGTQQFQRFFDRHSGSSGTCTVQGLDAATNHLYVSLSQNIMDHVPNAGSKAHTVIKIPSDGTKTGIYTYTGQSAGNGFDIVYGSSSLSTGNYTSQSTISSNSITLYTTQTTSVSSTSYLTEYYNASQNIGVDQTNMTGYHQIDIP